MANMASGRSAPEDIIQEAFEEEPSKEQRDCFMDTKDLDDPEVLQFIAELAALAGLPMEGEKELESSALEEPNKTLSDSDDSSLFILFVPRRSSRRCVRRARKMRARYGPDKELWPEKEKKQARATRQEVLLEAQTEPKKKASLVIHKKVPKNSPQKGAAVGKCMIAMNNYYRTFLSM